MALVLSATLLTKHDCTYVIGAQDCRVKPSRYPREAQPLPDKLVQPMCSVEDVVEAERVGQFCG